ncbi:uncharacterized protein NPIL_644251 [Nephila pilipes]|uniref:Uncharacterized protein n=1 Tax=Nephila pilipes TaxID=299642 RepID=A0A8X6M6A1_NEPPI|nr:uncharacterized protein NPIL_644251 [Nephila pilipes]
MLQNRGKLKLLWDSPLSYDVVKSFLKWWNEVDRLAGIEILRYFEINVTTQMHTFVVECKVAYATSVFLRSVTSHGVKIVLVRAKSRDAPLT